MNSKKIVMDALQHKQTGIVPIDFAATGVSGMHVTCVAALRDYYGLEKKPVKVYEPHQMLGMLDEDLKEIMGVDTEGAGPRKTIFGFPINDWKEWKLDNGLKVLVPEDFNTTVDNDGNIYVYPEGDTNARPSGKMPKGGYYFDSLIRQEDFDEENLDPEDNLEEFKPLDDTDMNHFVRSLKKAHKTGRAVVLNIGGTGLGDIAWVPAPFLKNPKGIRDVEEWYISTLTRQDYIHKVFEKQTDIAIENLKRIYDKAGELADILYVCGTDFGTQNSTFCSPDTFRELYMPYYKKITKWVHENTRWKTFKHCCGAIEPFINMFIESGFDILNPVQCSAEGMEPEKLKSRYGDNIVFWGGGVDTQKTLPFGKPEDVKNEVLKRCEIFSENGGYVFNAIHNVQANTPTENIAAMLEAVREFNGQ